ncbi:MAG TPA: hypothetical protein VIV11_20355 [Kofleriaceae bacterium]
MASQKDIVALNAKLEAQRAYFASDELLLERAALWRDATPEECLRATAEECEVAAQMLDQLEPEVAERALAAEPLPEDTVALLEQLRRQR